MSGEDDVSPEGAGSPVGEDRATGPGEREPDGGDRPARLVLPAAARRELIAGLEAAYPAEGCGVLLGEADGPDRRVGDVHPAENRWPEGGDRGGRYLVDPGTLRRLMDREAEGGPTILGFYHSHPDADPVPSETDRELAWPWYLYLVVPVREGEAGEGRAWQLDEDAGEFRERPVVGAGPDDGATGA